MNMAAIEIMKTVPFACKGAIPDDVQDSIRAAMIQLIRGADIEPVEKISNLDSLREYRRIKADKARATRAKLMPDV